MRLLMKKNLTFEGFCKYIDEGLEPAIAAVGAAAGTAGAVAVGAADAFLKGEAIEEAPLANGLFPDFEDTFPPYQGYGLGYGLTPPLIELLITPLVPE